LFGWFETFTIEILFIEFAPNIILKVAPSKILDFGYFNLR
jgi:hypothetical protein